MRFISIIIHHPLSKIHDWNQPRKILHKIHENLGYLGILGILLGITLGDSPPAFLHRTDVSQVRCPRVRRNGALRGPSGRRSCHSRRDPLRHTGHPRWNTGGRHPRPGEDLMRVEWNLNGICRDWMKVECDFMRVEWDSMAKKLAPG